MSEARAPKPSLEDVVERVTRHRFHPVHNGFTVDAQGDVDGVAALDDRDWRVRALALRDLARLGLEDPRALLPTLDHDNEHLRQMGSMVLGLLGADEAVDPASRLLAEDSQPIVRSQAAIALGQIGKGREVLERRAVDDESVDVRHQAALALGRLEQRVRVEPEVVRALAGLDEAAFGRVAAGDRAPDVSLRDTDDRPWRLADHRGARHVVLVWIFADWCPVCHREFHELIRDRARFEERGIAVATLECTDRYRARVMTGQEGGPDYWFAKHFPGERPQDPYPEGRWWPHLVDPGAAVGARYGVDPWEFAVHSEWVNRPSTVIVDPEGTVRFAHFGRFWGDRPTLRQVFEMIESDRYAFEPVPMRRGPH